MTIEKTTSTSSFSRNTVAGVASSIRSSLWQRFPRIW